MIADKILSRLDGVKQTGRGTWLACCPVHDDRSPSLSVTEKDGGVVLVNCFGCGAKGTDVCDALGIEYDALFPPKVDDRERPARVRNAFPFRDAFVALDADVLLVLQCIDAVRAGEQISDETRELLVAAGARIHAARQACNP